MRLLSSVAVTLLLVCASSAFGNNLLLNPSLEAPDLTERANADNWTTLQDPAMPEATMLYEPWGGHDGTELCWFKSWMGGAPWIGPQLANGGLEQAVAGNAGDTYELSAWFKMEAFYSGGDPLADPPTQQFLAIDYLDSSSSLISSAWVEVPSTNDATWRQYTVSGVAPPGTASVQARANFINGHYEPNATGGQSAMVDDFALTPEPATALALLALVALRRR